MFKKYRMDNEMFYLVIDIETKNTYSEIGVNDPTKLIPSYIGIYRSDTDKYEGYFGNDFEKFFTLLEKADYAVGYNIDGFDFEVLKPLCPYNLSKIPTVDMYKIAYTFSHVHIKLDNIASTTLGYGKSGDGLGAVRLFKEGKLDDLAKYCLDDVKITKEIYDYARKEGRLFYLDGMGMKTEVDIKMPAYIPKKIKEEGFGLF